MKAWVERGSGFKGVLQYALGEEKDAEVVGGNMAGSAVNELSSEFGVSRALRSDVMRPVWHTSLSLPEGEKLTSEKWGQITRDFMEEVGLDPTNHQFVAIRHSDTSKDHVHIVGSRIGLDGKLWHGQFEAKRAIEATQKLERKHDLTLTPGLESSRGFANVSKKELEEYERKLSEGHSPEFAMPPRMRIQAVIESATSGDKISATQYVETLKENGVLAKPNISEKTGRLSGFSYQIPGRMDGAFTGRKIGKDFTWNKLQEKVTYEQNRQSQEIINWSHRIDQERDGLLKRNTKREREDIARRNGAENGIDAGRRSINGAEKGVDRRGNEAPGLNQAGRQQDAVRNDLSKRREGEHNQGKESLEGVHNGAREASRGTIKEPEQKNESFVSSWRVRELSNRDRALSQLIRPSNQTGSMTKSVASKQAAFNKMQKSLDMKDVDIFVLDKNNEKGEYKYKGEKTFEKLSSLNARGANIYLKPKSEQKEYIIVSNLSKESLKDLRKDFKPNYVHKVSDRNGYQAVFVYDKGSVKSASQKEEKEALDKAAKYLNEKYGNGKTTRSLMAPGFSCQYSDKTFTRVSSAQDPSHRCETLTNSINKPILEQVQRRELAEQERQRLGAERRKEKERIESITERAHKIHTPEVYADLNMVKSEFVDELRAADRMASGKPHEKDWESIDHRAMVNTLKHNPYFLDDFGINNLIDAVKETSPSVHKLKEDPTGYARTVLLKALDDPEVQKAKKANEKYLAKEEQRQKQLEEREEQNKNVERGRDSGLDI